MDKQNEKTISIDETITSNECLAKKDHVKIDESDWIFDEVCSNHQNVIRECKFLNSSQENSNMNMNKDYFFSSSQDCTNDQDTNDCGRRMKEFTSSLQSWSFSLPFSANLPQLPSNPLPQWRQNLPNIRGYLSSNLNFPDLSAMPSFPLPSFPVSSIFLMVSSAMSSSSFQSHSPKKNWKQITECVHQTQCKLSRISSRIPILFNFRSLVDTNGTIFGTRVYFLSSLTNGQETTLIYADVEYNQKQTLNCSITNNSSCLSSDAKDSKSADDSSFDELNFNPDEVIFDFKPLIDANLSFKKWSDRCFDSNFDDRQEKLQLERKRIMLNGLTSYEFHEESKRFVFTCDGYLFYFDDVDQPPYTPIRLETSIRFAKINPLICPTNPDIIAYVSDGDIWVINVKSGHEIRLTTTKYNHDRHILSAGLPSYVIQEEFRRYNGFWWRPGFSTTKSLNGSTILQYHILYEEVDESNVELLSICSSSGTVEELHYPRAGKRNARSTLKLAGFKCDLSTNRLLDSQCYEIYNSSCLYSLFPDFEYLLGCDWYSRDAIWVQLLDRSQKKLVLGLFSLTNSWTPQVLLKEEMSSHWVNVNDVPPLFFDSDQSSNDELQFLWLSEKTGFKHIYLIKVKLVDFKEINKVEKFKSDTECNHFDKFTNDLKSVESLLIEKKQLTSGDWEVSNRFVWLDEKNRLVYFVGLKDSPLEKHLYFLSLDDESLEVQRLTDLGYSHNLIAFNSTLNLFVDIKSNISIPSFGYVNKKINQKLVCSVKKGQESKKANKDHEKSKVSFQKVGLILSNSIYSKINKLSSSLLNSKVLPAFPSQNDDDNFWADITKPELFTYRLKETDDVIYGLIFKPPIMEPGNKYPCVLDIYGGPEVQVVTNSFKEVRHARRHLLSSEGYIVCAFDCRGSHHRGVKFESHIQGRLGQVEINDQVEVLQWLADTTGYIDMSKIAVHGWSYGGYLSLMALAQRPDIFKIAIAGAPVVDWALYDTGYTERYMNIPSINPEGYEKSSVLNWVKSFPDEENRLLLLHGMMDENVHFIHTQTLIQALIKAGKPHQLQIYPTERHSLRKPPSCKHYEAVLVSFLQQSF